LDFARPIPAWGWLLIVVSGWVLAYFSYRRLEGRRWARGACAALRAGVLVLLALLISGPQLSRQTQTIEKDWVVVLADRSASMTLRDAPSPAGTVTRDEQLRGTFAAADAAWRAATKDRRVLWLAFDGAATALKAADGQDRPDLPPAKGRKTDLAGALAQALRLTAARPVSGVVLLTDGRTVSPPSEDLLGQFRARQIPVITVPLGSPEARADVAVGRVEAPRAAFVNDLVPVMVSVARTAGNTPADLKVRLVDKATGAVLDEQAAVWPEGSDPAGAAEGRAVLTVRPGAAGSATWVVEVVAPTPDIVPANDRAEVAVTLVDRPLRIAYFDGYPRWEYRYLKNLLVRETTIKSSVSLLASQRKLIQEGSDPLLSLPRTAQEWRPFDVVVLGDLRPEMFSQDQLTQLRDHIARDGAGLLLIGGPGPMPGSWRGTPVADLIPFRIGTEGAGVAPWLEPVLVRPTPVADRLGLLRLGEDAKEPWPAVLSDPAAGWSALRLAQKIDPASVKPAAETLATASGLSAGEGGAATPLVMTMRYGAGRVVYVATDEIWRWRYGRGETLPERFWLPIIRMLARQGLESSGQPAVLTASPQQAQVDRPVQVTVRLNDQSLLDASLRAVRVRAAMKPAGDGSPAPPEIELVLAPQAAGADADGAGTVGATNTLATAWLPTEAGVYTLRVDDPLIPAGVAPVEVTVAYPDDELRTPQTDHPLLAAIAEKTGGKTVEPARFGEAVAELPDRQVRLLGAPVEEALWDKAVVWWLLMVILALEWAGRRLIRLP
jgi:hypothetical protein